MSNKIKNQRKRLECYLNTRIIGAKVVTTTPNNRLTKSRGYKVFGKKILHLFKERTIRGEKILVYT